MIKTTDQLFPSGERRGFGSKADVRIREAAIAIYEGRGSKEDAELFFGDLAEVSGYFYTSSPSTSANELFYREGAREVFARILYLLDVPMLELSRMQSGALREMIVTQQEGVR